jgi:hypothetical protein
MIRGLDRDDNYRVEKSDTQNRMSLSKAAPTATERSKMIARIGRKETASPAQNSGC